VIIPVDEGRLWRRHEAMAHIGARADGGVDRPCLSPADREARSLLASWAAARRFSLSVDPVGNLFVRRPGWGAGPVVLTGSHMDSQPTGGRFDGIYGVLAGFEVLEALEDAGIETRLPVEIVAWTNEEGARFQPACAGSMCFSGARPLEDFLESTDRDGTSFATALAETLAALPQATPRPFGPPPKAYVEAHIEQGPVLERSGRTIGIVSGIQGASWFEITVTGECAHAGTTPLGARKDALRWASAMIVALGAAFADASDTTRFTVGRLDVAPNSPNTVADLVFFTIDLRHPDAGTLRSLADRVAPICRDNAGPCEVEIRATVENPPCRFDPEVIRLLAHSADQLGLPSMVLPSGAFHDAVYLQRVAPSGMVFVPCAGGVSHHPSESATPADLAAGCKVLAGALLTLAS
jgi:N-carbamoyl-L-amino-acid hydrolase